MAVGNRVKEYRVRRGVSLRELAREVEMDPTQLSRVERMTRSCSDEKKVLLSAYFGVPVGSLFFQDDVDEPSTEPVAAVDAVA